MCGCSENLNLIGSCWAAWAGLSARLTGEECSDVPAMLTWLMTQVRLMVLPAFTYSGPRMTERDSGRNDVICKTKNSLRPYWC